MLKINLYCIRACLIIKLYTHICPQDPGLAPECSFSRAVRLVGGAHQESPQLAEILLGTGISLPGAPVALQDFSMAMASVVQRKVMIKRFSWEIMGYLLIDRIFGRKKFSFY